MSVLTELVQFDGAPRREASYRARDGGNMTKTARNMPELTDAELDHVAGGQLNPFPIIIEAARLEAERGGERTPLYEPLLPSLPGLGEIIRSIEERNRG